MTERNGDPVGLVWTSLLGLSERETREMAREAANPVAHGRFLAFCWDDPQEWSSPTTPFEAWIIDEVLGHPSMRGETEADEFLYSAHLGVRLYKRESSTPSAHRMVLILRRNGEKPYKRRAQMDQSTLAKDVLETTMPVFTRDIANDIWHLPDNKMSDLNVFAGLAKLLCWSDERLLMFRTGQGFVSADHVRNRPWANWIPRATKRPYNFGEGIAAEQMVFPAHTV